MSDKAIEVLADVIDDSIPDIPQWRREACARAILKLAAVGYDGKHRYDIATNKWVPDAGPTFGTWVKLPEPRIAFDRKGIATMVVDYDHLRAALKEQGVGVVQ